MPALNLAGLFAILLLIAIGRPGNALLSFGYALAFVILLRERRWFAAVSRARARPPA